MFKRKIHQSTNGQWRITSPPQIIRDLKIEHGEELEIRPLKRGVENFDIGTVVFESVTGKEYCYPFLFKFLFDFGKFTFQGV